MLTKKEQRLRRARQTRIRIAQQGVARLTVNRTNLHIYASVISGDGSRHFLGFALAHADAAITVANHSQCSKTENTAALHDFGHAVDRDHFFAQTVVTTFVLHFGLKFSHFLFRSA